MMMIQDVAHAAYEAVQDNDRDAMDAAVSEILSREPYDIDTAMRAWVDRTVVLMGHGAGGNVRLKLGMISDHSGTGVPDPLQKVKPPDVAWAGKMFLAHVRRDAAKWTRLLSDVPVGALRLYVERMLTTMAVTALAYEEGIGDEDDDEEGDQDDPEIDCDDPIHVWVSADRRATGRRIAKAHLN